MNSNQKYTPLSKQSGEEFCLHFHKLPEIAQSALLTRLVVLYLNDAGLQHLSSAISRVIFLNPDCKILVNTPIAVQEIRYHTSNITQILSTQVGISSDQMNTIVGIEKN